MTKESRIDEKFSLIGALVRIFARLYLTLFLQQLNNNMITENYEATDPVQ